jgi:hypothetical protein
VSSTDTIATGEPVRAADLLMIAEQLEAATGPYPLGGFAYDRLLI